MIAATMSSERGHVSRKITEIKNLITKDDWRELAQDHLTESEIEFMLESSIEDFRKQMSLYKKYEAIKDEEDPFKQKHMRSLK